jgi:antibiotic biosynthesis monooxygenase (ABM) superfamily enzyme
VAVLLYNSVLFVFATPFNDLFVPSVAMLSLAIWSLIIVLADLEVSGFAVCSLGSTGRAYRWHGSRE